MAVHESWNENIDRPIEKSKEKHMAGQRPAAFFTDIKLVKPCRDGRSMRKIKKMISHLSETLQRRVTGGLCKKQKMILSHLPT